MPTAVDLSRAENRLEITWEGGHRSVYGGEQLRWACPCAECKGEAGSPGRLDFVQELTPEETSLEDAGLIGQYALQLTFKDGHGTGLYSFKYLRALDES